jgi:hypothetical protein
VAQLRLRLQPREGSLSDGGLRVADAAQFGRREWHQIHDDEPLREHDAQRLRSRLALHGQNSLLFCKRSRQRAGL